MHFMAPLPWPSTPQHEGSRAEHHTFRPRQGFVSTIWPCYVNQAGGYSWKLQPTTLHSSGETKFLELLKPIFSERVLNVAMTSLSSLHIGHRVPYKGTTYGTKASSNTLFNTAFRDIAAAAGFPSYHHLLSHRFNV